MKDLWNTVEPNNGPTSSEERVLDSWTSKIFYGHLSPPLATKYIREIEFAEKSDPEIGWNLNPSEQSVCSNQLRYAGIRR